MKKKQENQSNLIPNQITPGVKLLASKEGELTLPHERKPTKGLARAQKKECIVKIFQKP